MPWSMKTRRPIFAPGWISMPVKKRDTCERKRPSQCKPCVQHQCARRCITSACRPGITGQHLQRRARRGVALADAGDVFSQSAEHDELMSSVWRTGRQCIECEAAAMGVRGRYGYWPVRARTSARLRAHRLRDAAQDVHLFGRESGAIEQLVQARHQLLRRGRVEKADLDEHAAPNARAAPAPPRRRRAAPGAARGATSKPPSAWRQSYAISCTACARFSEP